MFYWQPGHQLNDGKFIVEKLLGSGGFGVTYKVKDLRTNKFLAIKTLNAQCQQREDFDRLQRNFINETIALASCRHPHIIRVYPQMFQEGRLWCMVMDYIEGEDLAGYVDTNGRFSEADAIELITKVGNALSHVHQQGFLHRDIKPNNILLRKSDLAPVLIDFGLAREYTLDTLRSMTNTVTECFAPIEQYENRGDFGAWTDVYALAATLYVLVTAELPIPSRFRTDAELAPPQKHNPSISDRLNRAVLKGMELEPGDRPRSVEEWLELLLLHKSPVKSAHPHDAKFFYERAREKFEKIDFKGAIEDCDQAISIDPEYAEAYLYRGAARYVLKDCEKSIEDYTQAINLNPEYANAYYTYYSRGLARYELKDYEKSIEDFTQAINLNPEYAEAYLYRGAARCDLKDYEKSIEDCTQAINLNLEYANAYYTYYNRGLARYELRDYEKSIEDYTQAINLNPEYAIAYCNRGLAHDGLEDVLAAIEDYTQAIRLNPELTDAYSNRGFAHYQIEDYPGAIVDCDQAIRLNPELADAYCNRGNAREALGDTKGAEADWKLARKINGENEPRPSLGGWEDHLQVFEFEVVQIKEIKTTGFLGLGKKEVVLNRRQGKAQYFREDLGNGVFLDMVAIPGGTFMMGASENEKDSRSNEQPPHRVTVPDFYMGKFPVTQEQWQRVSKLPQIVRQLEENPSFSKGRNNLPVDRVPWDDAVEFCARLSKATGKEYRLPSEAEWEYACRAGTTTPFYFGETITSNLANYFGSQSICISQVTKEGHTQASLQTTEVGSCTPNVFGLYDMYGNVWEWCGDNWHENYQGAPNDGSAWLDNSSAFVIRGGFWNYYPFFCRSAFRTWFARDITNAFCGFRCVVSRIS